MGGWAGGRDVEETDDVRLERMIDLNLRSAFYTVRAALPHLTAAEWGRIVLVGSRAALDNPPGQAAGRPRPPLDSFDSASYLEGTGDLVVTGRTGTNVADLWVLCRR